MFNSDGYILLDFTGVDITKSNQYLKGIYQRVINSIDTNKLALVINAGDLTPQAAIIHKRLNFYVITTSLYIFTVNSNDIIIIEQAGQSQVDVSIVPTLAEGVKVADFTIGAVEGSIYAPEFQTEINDNVTANNTTWSSDKIDDELSAKANTASLASVATTGDYDDLLNKPSIPSKTSDLTNDSGFITSAQVPTIDDNAVASDKVWSSYKTSAEIATKQNITDNNLATTDKTVVGAINEVRNYNNLTNKPTIPTKTSDLSNDSGFISSSILNKVTRSWGTSQDFTPLKQHYLVFINDYVFTLHIAGADLSAFAIRNLSTNTSASGSNTVSLDNITVTKITNGIRVQTNSSATISILG